MSCTKIGHCISVIVLKFWLLSVFRRVCLSHSSWVTGTLLMPLCPPETDSSHFTHSYFLSCSFSFSFSLYRHWEDQPILPSENNTKELNTAEWKKKEREGERWESRNPSANGLSWMKLNIQINGPSPWPERNFSLTKRYTHTVYTHSRKYWGQKEMQCLMSDWNFNLHCWQYQ